MSRTGVPGQTKLRYCSRVQVTGWLRPNHTLISDVPVLHWDYKWEEKIPEPGKEGIKWSAYEQGTHSSLSTGLTGRGSLVVWCELLDKRRDRVCERSVWGRLWASQTSWSQDQQNNTDLIMPVYLSGKKTVAASCYRVKDSLVWLQRCGVGLNTVVRDECVCFCVL